MKRIKKLFGGIDLSWKKLIIFALIAGVYTGIMALLPFAKNTSFKDIAITFEWWVLFGIIIITNSKSPIDSGLKCFVFFLISQPIVYLIQVPFFPGGWEIMNFYLNWIIWTLLTFPMGFVGYYLHKDKWWGLLILTPMLLLVGYHYARFLDETLSWFPHHLLSAIFCAATVLIYPIVIFDNKAVRRTGIAIAAVIITAMSVWGVTRSLGHSFYNTVILAGGDPENENYFDSSYSVSLSDEEYGKVNITYEDELDCYVIYAEFAKPGKTELIITSPDGQKVVYELTIDKNTYQLNREISTS